MDDQYLLSYVTRLEMTYWLIIAVALCLFFLLWKHYKKIAELTSLDKYRDSRDGLCDLLNSIEEIENGIILTKNGSLVAAFEYEGNDNNSTTNQDRNWTSQKLNDILARMDSGWMFHVDAVRQAVPKYFDRAASHFPDKVSYAIDEERRRFFSNIGNSYSSKFILTVTWLPPTKNVKKLEKILYTGGPRILTDEEASKKLVREFKEHLANLENSLKVVFKSIKMLEPRIEVQENGESIQYDDLLSWLYFCLTGLNQKFVKPKQDVFLDRLLAGQDFVTGRNFKIGNKFGRVIAIEGLGSETMPGLLTSLCELGCDYRLSERFIFLNYNDSKRAVHKLASQWAIKQHGFLSMILRNEGEKRPDMDAVAMTEELRTAETLIESKMLNFGFLSTNLIFLDDDKDRLDKNIKIALQQIEYMGLVGREEKDNCVEAFLGSLPSHGYENVRRPIVSTANFADLIPISSPWIGKDKCPCDLYPENSPALMQCLTGAGDNTSFRLNLHVGQLGHTLIFGPTGAGKSVLLCTLMAQFRRYKNMAIYAFDKGMSMFTLTHACGGSHYIPGKDQGLAFCPLGIIKSDEDVIWGVNWMEVLLTLNKVDVTVAMRNEIKIALNTMLANRRQDPNFDMSLTMFSLTIQNDTVRETLTQYLAEKEGSASLIDAKVDTLSISNFCTFEMEHLMGLGDQYVIPVITYLFYCIEKSVDETPRPTLIVLDEAWMMFTHPTFQKKIKEWLKVMRKKNCAVIMATQEINDLVNNPIFSTLNESCKTKIYLPNSGAMQEKTYEMYSSVGLNVKQIKNISDATPQKDYYIQSDKYSRMISLNLLPLSLLFVAVSDPEKVKHIKDLIDQYGDEEWPNVWCLENNIDLRSYLNGY